MPTLPAAGESQGGDHGKQEEEASTDGPHTNAAEAEEVDEDVDPANLKGLEPSNDDAALKELKSKEGGREKEENAL